MQRPPTINEETLFRDRTPEAAARQLATVLAWAAECELATLEGLRERKSTSKHELRRHEEIAVTLVRHCRELGVEPRGIRGSPCPRLIEQLNQPVGTTNPA